ncbi:MAG: flagellar biosynthesis protein FlgN [Spirochaetaceae bacterium]|jgi:hypothetical protein|nr:flagellar biosynthesis protein FlgN [Spirochaetaceae bacterium]
MTTAIEKTTKISGNSGGPGALVLNSGEVERRVAILKRFRELLSQQRDRFRQYLDVLDKQKNVIEQGNADDLIAHVELEEKIVGDIFAIQKVIDPLEDMYRRIFSPARPMEDTGTLPREIHEVPTLKAALEELKAEAVIRSGRNRELLAKRLEEIRTEMKTLRANPYAIHRSAYSGETASLVDIKG